MIYRDLADVIFYQPSQWQVLCFILMLRSYDFADFSDLSQMVDYWSVYILQDDSQVGVVSASQFSQLALGLITYILLSKATISRRLWWRALSLRYIPLFLIIKLLAICGPGGGGQAGCCGILAGRLELNATCKIFIYPSIKHSLIMFCSRSSWLGIGIDTC